MKKNVVISWEEKSWSELTKEDLYAIGQLRMAVFVVEQNCPYQDFDGNDNSSDHLLGFNELGELLAYSRIVYPGITYPQVSIGRVVVSQGMRGQKLGETLMKKSISFVKRKYGNTTIHISAQEHLYQFYHRLGFKQVTKMYLEDDIPHIGMELVLK